MKIKTNLSTISLFQPIAVHYWTYNACIQRRPMPPSSSYTASSVVDLREPFSPAVNGSSSDVACSLPFQRANSSCYVGYTHSSADFLITDSISQRNPEHSLLHSTMSDNKFEFKLMDFSQPKQLNGFE